MARPLRLAFPNALYHVTSRGNRCDNIFESDDDRQRWLSTFAAVCSRFNWRCHAYCLMDNHYHIVVETPEANLSSGMRQLNGVYTQAFNRANNRVGHVFQGRFKGILVEKESYMLEICRYVVLNPMRAGMVGDASEYLWSSYRATVGQEKAPDWLETDELLVQFGKQRKRAIGHYIDFVREGVGLASIWNQTRNQVFLGSDEFVEKHGKDIKEKESLSDIPKAQKRAPAKPLSFYQEKYSQLNTAIAQAYLCGGYTQKEVGDFFGCHYTTVSRIVKEAEGEA